MEMDMGNYEVKIIIVHVDLCFGAMFLHHDTVTKQWIYVFVCFVASPWMWYVILQWVLGDPPIKIMTICALNLYFAEP